MDPAGNDSIPVADLPKDLSTIDIEAFASLSNEAAACPSTPATSATPAMPAMRALPQATPATPVTSAALVETNTAASLLLCSCQRRCHSKLCDRRKVPSIQKALEKETQRHKCALKLLPYFFTQEQ